MITEICVFVSIFAVLMLKIENKSEWLYNIKHNRRRNWDKKWHKIPVTKMAFVLFVVLLVSGVVSSFITFEINYMVWDLFFIIHFTLFLVASASLYLFAWCLGGRAKREGKAVGKLSKVEGTEPSGKKKAKGKSFADGMVKSAFDVAFGKSERREKKKD